MVLRVLYSNTLCIAGLFPTYFLTHGTWGWQESVSGCWKKTQEVGHIQLFDDDRPNRSLKKRRLLCWQAAFKRDGHAVHNFWLWGAHERARDLAGWSRSNSIYQSVCDRANFGVKGNPPFPPSLSPSMAHLQLWPFVDNFLKGQTFFVFDKNDLFCVTHFCEPNRNLPWNSYIITSSPADKKYGSTLPDELKIGDVRYKTFDLNNN